MYLFYIASELKRKKMKHIYLVVIDDNSDVISGYCLTRHLN